jgi:predicted dehydrogenase
MKIWNFGIIGAGSISDFHAKAVKSLRNAKLIGICGTNQEKVKVLALKYSCKAFRDATELLDSQEIDIILIATPSGAHMRPVIEAACHGKHVLCEKPLEVKLERIDKMIAAHETAGTKLGGIFNYRFAKAVRILKKAVDNGRFGVITNASVYVPWWRNDEYYLNSWRGTWALDGGGALMNQSIHMVDLLQYMMGPVVSLNAYTAKLGHSQIEVEDIAVAILKFKNKALGTVYGSTASYPGQPRRLEITGTKGTVIMEDCDFKIWQFDKQSEEDIEIKRKYSTIGSGGGASDPLSIPFELHAQNIAAFINSIEQNSSFEIDGKEAKKSIEIVLGIYESAKNRREVFFS